jgi:AcrR family transcriptional regulator
MAGTIRTEPRAADGASSRPPAGIRELRRLELAAKIEHTALELFAAGGFEGVTGDDIASAVGISRRTVFRYFPGGKEEIVLRDLRRRMARLREAVALRPADETPLVALRNALIDLAEGYEGDHDLAAMRGKILLGAPSVAARVAGEQMTLTAAIVEMIAARMGVDARRDPRPAVIVAASLGAVQVAFGMWLREGGDLQALTTQCLAVVDGGLERAERPLELTVGG